ncbi:hypothetical protein AVEN_168536-1 [Araneus ventricosus]|uniref:Uncharacterized protein n=1 Tax=Araneus ventricosus TaxID=182803 RepID=A0A4Y2T405_ARAVE|nr:hypothetical protein AVEN_168536-1 [Araneus ventricosus]
MPEKLEAEDKDWMEDEDEADNEKKRRKIKSTRRKFSFNPLSGAMEILKRLRNATFVKLSCTSKRQQFLTMNIPSPFLRLENTPMSKERHDSDLYYCGL